MINKIIVTGKFKSNIKKDHAAGGHCFYIGWIEAKRKSGAIDTIPVILPGSLLQHAAGLQEIRGQLRTYNARSHVRVYVLAQEIQDTKENVNICNISGTICKKPTLRTTPRGFDICDFILAINRAHGKSAYIPCIAWNREARKVAACSTGTHLTMCGRIQSRQYNKGTCIEVSIFEIIKITLPNTTKGALYNG